MPNADNYDPAKAHAYYERTKKLKGRKSDGSSRGSGLGGPGTPESGIRPRLLRSNISNKPKVSPQTSASNATVVRLKAKVVALSGALSKAKQALSEKRAAARETEKDNSDGKSTAKEKQASKEYRDKNKAEIASKRKSESNECKNRRA